MTNLVQFPGGTQSTVEQPSRDITITDSIPVILANIGSLRPEGDAFAIRVLATHEDPSNEMAQAVGQTAQAFAETAATQGGETSVDWQEKYLDKLDRDVSDIKQSMYATEERIAAMVSQTLGEMRDRDNQRHAEVQTIRADMQAIRSDNEETRRWIIGMAIATIIGVAAMVVAVLLR